MDVLPDEMLFEILNKMDNISLDNISRTSTRLRAMANDIAAKRLQKQHPKVYAEMKKLTSYVPYAEVLVDLNSDSLDYYVVSSPGNLWNFVPNTNVIMRTIANNLTYAVEYAENILTSDNTQAVESYYLYTHKNHNMPVVKYLNQKYPSRAKNNMLGLMGRIMEDFMPEYYTLTRYMTKDNIRFRDKDMKYLQDLYELTREMPISIKYSNVTILEVIAAAVLSENMEYIKWFLKVYHDLFVEHKDEIIDLVLKSVNSEFIQKFREEYQKIILDRDQDFINALEHLDDLTYETEQERVRRESRDALHRLGQNAQNLSDFNWRDLPKFQ